MCLSATRGRLAAPTRHLMCAPAARSLARRRARRSPPPTRIFNPMHRVLPRIAAPRPSSRLRPILLSRPRAAAACSPSHAPRAHRAAPLRGARLCRAAARSALRYTLGVGSPSQSSSPRCRLALPISTLARSLSLRRCATDLTAHQLARRVTPRRAACLRLLRYASVRHCCFASLRSRCS